MLLINPSSGIAAIGGNSAPNLAGFMAVGSDNGHLSKPFPPAVLGHSGGKKPVFGIVRLEQYEVADMFTKQIFPKHFERLRRVMMGHENFDDMQARYVQVKASGDDMDDPKLYVDSKPGRPPK